MSTRRAPLSVNPNVVNSPLRGVSTFATSKQKRSFASTQREENYGQPPPAKRQMTDAGARATLRSPTKQRILVQRASARQHANERAAQAAPLKLTEEEIYELRKWQENQRARFPRLVFYFDNIPDDYRTRMRKQIERLGAREDRFFSKEITHIVTSRHVIRSDKPDTKAEALQTQEIGHDEPQTINPSLLSRTYVQGQHVSIKRRLFENASGRKLQPQAQDDALRRPRPSTTQNTSIVHRARDMGIKIWSMEKLQRVAGALLEDDPYKSAALGWGLRNTSAAQNLGAGGRVAEETDLLHLLHKERVSGPSDRDPTVSTRELTYFKGPYIYVYDIEEKQKPIMVREYAKVADKTEGDWPQLRSTNKGRCPFVEDLDYKEEKMRLEAAAKVAAGTSFTFQPPEAPHVKPVTDKYALQEIEDGHNKGTLGLTHHRLGAFDVITKAVKEPSIDFRPQNAFTSRAKPGRFLAGEPVASGVQPSGITSAIRSQMISSATGTLGSKAGTSKEIHGLQRKVLQKSGHPSTDLSSRRMAEMSMDHASLARSTTSHRRVELGDDKIQERSQVWARHRQAVSVVVHKKQRDPKPGYCENCQDKFDDFEDHIVSRKHRKFAENNKNWIELDMLLSLLERF